MSKFKVDENMPAEVAALMRAAGHDAVTVIDQQLGGRSDYDVAEACRREERAIVTLDLDFADIRAYPPASHSGIVVLRLARLDLPQVLSAMRRLLPTFDTEPLDGKLWIVDASRVRIRG